VLFRPKFGLKNTSYDPNGVIDRNIKNSFRTVSQNKLIFWVEIEVHFHFGKCNPPPFYVSAKFSKKTIQDAYKNIRKCRGHTTKRDI
jgi:hypothetical protein